MSEFSKLNEKQKELLRLLKEARKLSNFHFDVSSFSRDQRKGFATMITPFIMANVQIVKAIAILEGIPVEEVMKTKDIDIVKDRMGMN